MDSRGGSKFPALKAIWPGMAEVARREKMTLYGNGSARCHLQHMGVDHSSRHITVAQKLLHRANIGARLQQVRGKAVAQGVPETCLQMPPGPPLS